MEPIPFVMLAAASVLICAAVSGGAAAAKDLDLPPDAAEKAGRQIRLNETGGRRDAIAAWNANEDFASLGIGHFIWFPAKRPDRFEESFPRLLTFLREQGVSLPAWLDKTPIPACPWNSKADFEKNFRSPRMVELRKFLLKSVGPQTRFLVARMQHALPKILASLSEAEDRNRVQRQFDRVVASSKDLYPLVDYINFKGEGIAPSETFMNKTTGVREGWGLKQVLMEMTGTEVGAEALTAFADAAKKVLTRRIENNPGDRVWQAGWMKRCDTYRRPLP